MRFQKIALLFLAISMGVTACVIDFRNPESVSPIVDPTRDQETEIVKTQAFQGAVDTAVAATVNAKPSHTPIPTNTPEPTSTFTPMENGTPIAGSTRSVSPDRFDIAVEGQPFLGSENAPVVVVEFSDFNCGYCRKWHQETFQILLDAYPGQIRFVYRDFPFLSEESFNAAVAAQCAYEQGAFWGYHDRLFTRSETKGLETYLLFAQELGLDVQDFQSCFYGEGAEEEVLSDLQFASGIGIQGTPTFFINGIPLVGAQPIDHFMEIIDRELGE
jgi:protein-disulfide isomerase